MKPVKLLYPIFLSCLLFGNQLAAQIPAADRSLYNAIIAGDTAGVSNAISQGASLRTNSCDASATPVYDPVQLAALKGNLYTLDILVNKGADLGECENIVLALAARFGNGKVVQYLWQHNIQNTGAAKYLLTSVCNGMNYDLAQMYVTILNIQSMNAAEQAAAGIDQAALLKMFEELAHPQLGAEHIETLKFLLSAGLDINEKDDEGSTGIMYAYQNGSYQLSNYLKSLGAVMPPMTTADQFYLACYNGDLATVKDLQRQGFNIDQTDAQGNNGLLKAAEGSQDAVVAYLISSHANLGVTNPKGLTAIALSCQNGDLKSARALAENGADLLKADNRGVSPLFYAAASGNYDLFLYLCGKGADPTGQDAERNSIYHYLFQYGPRPRVLLSSPDYLAGHLTIVNYLLRKAVPFDQPDSQGGYPLTALVTTAFSANTDDIFKLYAAGNLSQDQLGQGIRAATASAHLNYLEELLKKVNPGQLTPNPLFTAIFNNRTESVPLLLKYQVNVNAAENGRSPLLYALIFSRRKIIKLLLDGGADIDYIAPDGKRVTDYAGFYTDLFFTRFLKNQLLHINTAQAVTDYDRKDIVTFNTNLNLAPPDMSFDITGYLGTNPFVREYRFANNYKFSFGNPPRFLYEGVTVKNQNEFSAKFNANIADFSSKTPLIWEVSMASVIPACVFNIAHNATAYPKMVIKNTGRDGLVIARQLADHPLMPGDTLVLDRSAGPVTVLVDRFRKNEVSLALSVRYNIGPPILNIQDFKFDSRFKVYIRLYEWSKQLEGAGSGVEAATAATASHITSEYAVANRYVSAIQLSIEPLTKRIDNAPVAITALRKFYVLHNQIDFTLREELLSKVNDLLASTTDQGQQALLQQIKKDIESAIDRETLSGSYLKMFATATFDQLSADIAQLQMYLLELAQYVDAGSLAAASGATTYVHLKDNILSSDVFISDSDVGGKGKNIKQIIQ